MRKVEIIQESADSMRVLKAGLRGHDSEVVDVTFTRISQRYGADLAERVVFETITQLMDKEDWSWFDADGNPSPLLNHNLPK